MIVDMNKINHDMELLNKNEINYIWTQEKSDIFMAQYSTQRSQCFFLIELILFLKCRRQSYTIASGTMKPKLVLHVLKETPFEYIGL